jgi:hypothetical protein
MIVIGNIFYHHIADTPTLNELDRIVEEAFPGRTAEKILWTFVVT